MEDLPLGRIAALVPEFAVKDVPLGRTLGKKTFFLNVMSFEIKVNIFCYRL